MDRNKPQGLIQQQLNAKLDEAIESWCGINQGPQTTFCQRQESKPPRLTDSAVGTHARYHQQWNKRTQEPTINPSQLIPAALFTQPPRRAPTSATTTTRAPPPWWMSPDEEYGLLQPAEQSRLESAALSARSNRPSLPVPDPPFRPGPVFDRKGYRPAPQPSQGFFGQELSAPEAQRVVPKVPFRYKAVQQELRDEGLDPEEFVDADFDAQFWEKRPPRGDIWAARFLDSPRYGRKDPEPLAPPEVVGRRDLSFAARMEAARRG
ncbi:hypothetical protein B0T25DRAFT_610490 [Lasiosphaeria hispida]|uniref:Uncharacterized protein n=1 Tax=Lasiosphaeria hispida TaxID=260671 RepID=A0AAJ0HFF0_9PEZI|nr:hypothetical protein B0T25DRAFT_610490 [Lasiosphaeria hispida]